MDFDQLQDEGQLAAALRLLRRGDLAEAEALFGSLYAAAESRGDARLMAACLCEMAWARFKLGDPDKALQFAMGAKTLWRRLDDPSELARATIVEAFVFLDLGLSDEAYDLAIEGLALAEKLDENGILAFALTAHGLVLSICQESELALPQIGRAVQLARDDGNLVAAAFYTLILSFAHARLAGNAGHRDMVAEAGSQMADAIEHGLEAVDLADRAGDFWTLRVALCNAAEFLSSAGRVDEARLLLQRWEVVPGTAETSLRTHQLYTLALVELASGNHDEARKAAEESLCLAEAGGQIDHQVNAAEVLSRAFEALGDMRSALDMHRRYHKYSVQQSGEGVRRRARVAEIRSETDRLRVRMAELADMAMSDPLTGIANRRSFDHILNRLAGGPLAVAIVDIDHFKQVNDRYTHIVGDAVLRQMARIMVEQLGSHGHVARLGGEEFALLFPDAPLTTAAAMCEGIRFAIGNADWDKLTPGMRVTVSIGVAADDGDRPTGELMQLADARLYGAKTAGRNRVMAEDVPAPRQTKWAAQ